MTSFDASNTRLATLPSSRTALFAQALVQAETDELSASLRQAERDFVAGAADALKAIAGFNPNKTEIENAESVAKVIRDMFGGIQSAQRLLRLAVRLESFYLPFVEVPTVCCGEFLEIRQGVDINIPFGTELRTAGAESQAGGFSFRNWLVFILGGWITFELKIPLAAAADPVWSRTDSLHLQLNLPAGITVTREPRALPEELFEGIRITDEFASVSADYVYAYIRGSDAVLAQERIQRLRDERGTALGRFRRLLTENAQAISAAKKNARGREVNRDQSDLPTPPLHGTLTLFQSVLAWVRLDRRVAEAERPRLRIKARVRNGIRLLTAFLWIVALFAYALQLAGTLGSQVYVDLFAALLLVIFTLSVYVLDKPFLVDPVFSHVAASTAVFFELPLLAKYAPVALEWGRRTAALLGVG